jgi:hypothetical protein
MLIPGMIQSLELIQNNLSKQPPDMEGSKRLAGGLGRAVTEDFSFSESRLGTKLLDIVNELLNE